MLFFNFIHTFGKLGPTAHDYFQRFHNGNMKGGPEGEGSWTVIHKYSSQCVLALYVKLIPLQVVYYYHLFVFLILHYLVNSSGTD